VAAGRIEIEIAGARDRDRLGVARVGTSSGVARSPVIRLSPNGVKIVVPTQPVDYPSQAVRRGETALIMGELNVQLTELSEEVPSKSALGKGRLPRAQSLERATSLPGGWPDRSGLQCGRAFNEIGGSDEKEFVFRGQLRAFKHIRKPDFRIHAVELCRVDQRCEHSEHLSAGRPWRRSAPSSMRNSANVQVLLPLIATYLAENRAKAVMPRLPERGVRPRRVARPQPSRWPHSSSVIALTFRVDTPCTYISAKVATSARSER